MEVKLYSYLLGAKNVAVKPAIPQPIANIHIVLMEDKTLTISGMPQDATVALAIIKELNRGVFEHFIQLAKDGQLDKDNTRIVSPLIRPEEFLTDSMEWAI